MNRRYTIPFLIILFAALPSHSQWLLSPRKGCNLLFRSLTSINSHRFGHNPAFMLLDDEPERLTLSSFVQYTDAEYRQFIDPGQRSFLQQTASGKKTIDSVHVFYGQFGFQKEIRNDWSWLATKNYTSGSPFLLGDSTTGSTHYDGIVMRAIYARPLGSRFYVGAELNYYVDEGLKKISPKPTSKHRDIDSRVGMGVALSDRLTLGGHVHFYDANEEIRYREDKESVAQETILFKFKGIDLPQVINKKVESRYSYHHTLSSSVTATYHAPSSLSMSLYAGTGTSELDVKDDAITPLLRGHWQQSETHAGLMALWQVADRQTVGIQTRVFAQNAWARHPDYAITLSERDESRIHTSLSWQIDPSPLMSIGLEGGLALDRIESDDYYSSVFWKRDGQTLFGRLGLSRIWQAGLKSMLILGVTVKQIRDDELDLQSPSTLFSSFRRQDILYWLSDVTSYTLCFTNAYRPSFGGTILFNTFLQYDTAEWQNRDRTSLDVALSYQVPLP